MGKRGGRGQREEEGQKDELSSSPGRKEGKTQRKQNNKFYRICPSVKFVYPQQLIQFDKTH